jgi:hypothetical protein
MSTSSSPGTGRVLHCCERKVVWFQVKRSSQSVLQLTSRNDLHFSSQELRSRQVNNGCRHFSRDPRLSLRTRRVVLAAEVKFSPESVAALRERKEAKMMKTRLGSATLMSGSPYQTCRLVSAGT